MFRSQIGRVIIGGVVSVVNVGLDVVGKIVNGFSIVKFGSFMIKTTMTRAAMEAVELMTVANI